MKRIWVLMLALFVVFFIAGCSKGKEEAAPKAGMAQEFSATAVSTGGGQTVATKMYVKAGKIRTEVKAAPGTYTIARPDLEKVWMVVTANKSYMEVPFKKEQESNVPAEKTRGEVSRKAVGTETIDGQELAGHFYKKLRPGKVLVVRMYAQGPLKGTVQDAYWSDEGSFSAAFRKAPPALEAGSKPAAASEPAQNRKKLSEIDLSKAPVSTDITKLKDLFEEVPSPSNDSRARGNYGLRNTVKIVYQDAGAALYHVTDKSVFYVQRDGAGASTLHYYGPFGYDPTLAPAATAPASASKPASAAARGSSATSSCCARSRASTRGRRR